MSPADALADCSADSEFELSSSGAVSGEGSFEVESSGIRPRGFGNEPIISRVGRIGVPSRCGMGSSSTLLNRAFFSSYKPTAVASESATDARICAGGL